MSEPTSWNSLPQSFRDATPTLGQFQRRLKTSLFRLASGRDLTALHSWLCRLLERRTINVRTELNCVVAYTTTALFVASGTARVGTAHMVLRGHRSIVNQVRYNKSSALTISSGVEKIIKVSEVFVVDSVRPQRLWNS